MLVGMDVGIGVDVGAGVIGAGVAVSTGTTISTDAEEKGVEAEIYLISPAGFPEHPPPIKQKSNNSAE